MVKPVHLVASSQLSPVTSVKNFKLVSDVKNTEQLQDEIDRTPFDNNKKTNIDSSPNI